MDKIRTIEKEIEALEVRKKTALKIISEQQSKIQQMEQQKKELNGQLGNAYGDFFNRKTNQEFVLYDEYPSMDALICYMMKNCGKFPLYDYGTLNVKELAEIIKYVYQFKTEKEYQVLTIGTIEDEVTTYGQISSIIPHLYFMIGNESTLNSFSFKELDQKFICNASAYCQIFLYGNKKELITIELEKTYGNSQAMNIECLTKTDRDKLGRVNYYDVMGRCYENVMFNKNKNIFNPNIYGKIRNIRNQENFIRHVFNFSIHTDDSFLADILISIIIYKRNNHIEELSTDDYNHIFDVLFHEKVDIKGDSEKDIPKQLVYFPYKS